MSKIYKKHFKDADKNNLKALSINIGDLGQMAAWKTVIFDCCKTFEVERIEHCISKWALQKQVSILVPRQPEHVYNICSRACLSKDELSSQYEIS